MLAGQEVAVEKFILQDQDNNRSFYDVCKHECKVFVALQSLWEAHVPKLLFRHPGKTWSMIGLQLAEQVLDDGISALDPDGRTKAEETIQEQLRGYDSRGIRRFASEKHCMTGTILVFTMMMMTTTRLKGMFPSVIWAVSLSDNSVVVGIQNPYESTLSSKK